MKILNSVLIFAILVISLSSCSSSPICECFEVRLEIKNMYQEVDGIEATFKMTQTQEYKDLKAKKKECKNVIEPEFFDKVKTEYKNEEDLLRGELGDCEAVMELLDKH